VLLLSSRGITHRMRHLMNDLETLLPHIKKGVCSYSWIHFSFLFLFFCYRRNADKRVNWTVGGFQIRSSTRRTTSTCCPNSRIYIHATTRSTLRRGGTRTCTSGRPRHRTGRASSCTYRTCTRWTNSR
jgi:hypothetical protein